MKVKWTKINDRYVVRNTKDEEVISVERRPHKGYWRVYVGADTVEPEGGIFDKLAAAKNYAEKQIEAGRVLLSVPEPPTWDLWVYRENVGWWLEEEGLIEDEMAKQLVAWVHNATVPEKFVFLFVPAGKRPSDYTSRSYAHEEAPC